MSFAGVRPVSLIRRPPNQCGIAPASRTTSCGSCGTSKSHGHPCHVLAPAVHTAGPLGSKRTARRDCHLLVAFPASVTADDTDAQQKVRQKNLFLADSKSLAQSLLNERCSLSSRSRRACRPSRRSTCSPRPCTGTGNRSKPESCRSRECASSSRSRVRSRRDAHRALASGDDGPWYLLALP